jgi:hypothetical protein
MVHSFVGMRPTARSAFLELSLRAFCYERSYTINAAIKSVNCLETYHYSSLEAVMVGMIGSFVAFFVYYGITKQYGKDKLVFSIFTCLGGLFVLSTATQIVGAIKAKKDTNNITTVVGPLSLSDRTVQGSTSIKIAEKSFFADGLQLTVNESKRTYFRVPEQTLQALNRPGEMAAVTYSDQFKSLDGRPFVMRLYRCN